MDRLEYWVIAKDVAAGPKAGDELSFYINENGLEKKLKFFFKF